MEYLMTYGWAILIVIIVAAALYALGIFNPSTYTGRIPTGFTTLGTPDDWDLDTSGNFDIILRNRLNYQITVYNVSVEAGSMVSYNDSSFTMNADSEKSYMASDTGLNLGTQSSGSTYTVDVSMLYGTPGKLNHTETGRVTGSVKG